MNPKLDAAEMQALMDAVSQGEPDAVVPPESPEDAADEKALEAVATGEDGAENTASAAEPTEDSENSDSGADCVSAVAEQSKVSEPDKEAADVAAAQKAVAAVLEDEPPDSTENTEVLASAPAENVGEPVDDGVLSAARAEAEAAAVAAAEKAVAAVVEDEPAEEGGIGSEEAGDTPSEDTLADPAPAAAVEMDGELVDDSAAEALAAKVEAAQQEAAAAVEMDGELVDDSAAEALAAKVEAAAREAAAAIHMDGELVDDNAAEALAAKVDAAAQEAAEAVKEVEAKEAAERAEKEAAEGAAEAAAEAKADPEVDTPNEPDSTAAEPAPDGAIASADADPDGPTTGSKDPPVVRDPGPAFSGSPGPSTTIAGVGPVADPSFDLAAHIAALRGVSEEAARRATDRYAELSCDVVVASDSPEVVEGPALGEALASQGVATLQLSLGVHLPRASMVLPLSTARALVRAALGGADSGDDSDAARDDEADNSQAALGTIEHAVLPIALAPLLDNLTQALLGQLPVGQLLPPDTAELGSGFQSSGRLRLIRTRYRLEGSVGGFVSLLWPEQAIAAFAPISSGRAPTEGARRES